MEKASDVYIYITDNSFQTGGFTNLRTIIPMLTTKGKLGINEVNANNFKDVLGYDLKYNSNYLGLQEVLENVTSAFVWRLNQNSKLGNAYFLSGNEEKQSNTDCENFEELTMLDPIPSIVVANKYNGNSGTTAVKINPRKIDITVQNNNPTVEQVQTITLEDINQNETIEFDGRTINNAIVFNNASNNSIVGVIVGNKVYKVLDDIIDYDVIENDVVVEDRSCGTFEMVGDNANIVLTKPLTKESFYTINTIPNVIEEWNLTVSEYTDNQYLVKKLIPFSVNLESSRYWENVDFEEVQLFLKDVIPQNLTTIRDYFTLDNGSNGDIILNAFDIDTTILDNVNANIMITNGVTDYKVVNRLANVCDKKKIHLFVDEPSYEKYIDCKQWRDKILASKYVAICARPDRIYDNTGKYFYIYPSVKYITIYANMLSNYGRLNYPPAGRTYGTVSTNDLIECDYQNYADEMKTYRINYLVNDNGTSMMWEQRTTYPLNTDLSYIAPVFIIDELCDQLIAFEKNFNFRYMSRTDLLNQQSGLTSMLDSFVTDGFIYRYELDVPDYDTAQKSGKTLNINIKVAVMEDSEIININLELING